MKNLQACTEQRGYNFTNVIMYKTCTISSKDIKVETIEGPRRSMHVNRVHEYAHCVLNFWIYQGEHVHKLFIREERIIVVYVKNTKQKCIKINEYNLERSNAKIFTWLKRIDAPVLIIPSTLQSGRNGIGFVLGNRISTRSRRPWAAACSIGILHHAISYKIYKMLQDAGYISIVTNRDAIFS